MRPWGVKITAPATACVTVLGYDWGPLMNFNSHGGNLRPSCNGTDAAGIFGMPTKIPTEPLHVAWSEPNGQTHSVSVPVQELTQGLVDGGSLYVRITGKSVELWVAEPDKSMDPNAPVWPLKAPRLVYSAPGESRPRD